MTVLVTGGCGYIGAHVVHALHQAGERVVVVDDLSYGKPARIEGARLYGMDIAAPGAGDRLAEILDAEDVDSVIHFAARKQVGESVEKPLWYYQQNINGMLNVLTGMTQSKNAKKLVFSSSAATYGVPPVDVVPEDVVPMLPINPYGQTKLFGEWMGRACAQPVGLSSSWRRCSSGATWPTASSSAPCATSTWPDAVRWSWRTPRSSISSRCCSTA